MSVTPKQLFLLLPGSKKVTEFVQAGMIERITAGARHAHHTLITALVSGL
jgi:hypothetical protein